MTLTQYIVGNKIRIVAAFVDENGVPVDPNAVTGEIRLPDQTIEELTMTNPAVGTWEATFTITQNGLHEYRVEGTGTLDAAGEGQFTGQGMFEEEA